MHRSAAGTRSTRTGTSARIRPTRSSPVVRLQTLDGLASSLGTTQGQIAGLVVRDSTVLVGVGVVSGLAISVLVTRPLATLLVAGLSVTDPLSLAGTAVAFGAVTVLASWLPARRAMRVGPALGMRLE